MRKKLSVLILSVFILTLLPTISVQAKKPIGTMDLTYNLAVTGPTDKIPDWVGSIEIDGKDYGMLFFAIGSGKAFDDAFKGNIHFFEEIWAIYDLGDKIFPDLPNELGWDYWLPANGPSELVLWGKDKGQTNIQNSKYRMNGDIKGAFGDFEMWMGHNVHMSGQIEWQNLGTPENPIIAPFKAPGTFKIN